MSVPSVPSEVGGNTRLQPSQKKDNPKRNWAWTYFNEELNWKKFYDILVPKCQKFIFQHEVCPSTGRHHFQGQLTLKKKERWEGILKWLPQGIHLEPTISLYKSEVYCGKRETRVEGPWSFGLEKEGEVEGKWTRIVLKPWQVEIEELVRSEPDERSIYWYWESEGGIGKTTFCKYLYSKYKVSVSTSGMSEKDLFYIVSEERPKCLLIDLSREDQEKTLKMGAVEQVKNGFFGSGKYEGKSYCGDNPHVIIFANRPPSSEEMRSLSKDRWRVKQLQ